jgi:hypothetical protein
MSDSVLVKLLVKSMKAISNQLTQFLQHDLAIPMESISSVMDQCPHPNRLIIGLWQQRLMTLAQLDRLLGWLENHSSEFL